MVAVVAVVVVVESGVVIVRGTGWDRTV